MTRTLRKPQVKRVRPGCSGAKDGTAVRYLQLVHNEWEPAGKSAALREPGLSYQGSVAFGGPWLLDQWW